jgi:hypothetical protein
MDDRKSSSVYWGESIRCQSDHGDYVYPCGGVAMLGDDGTSSSNSGPIARHAWAHVVTSCPAWH